MKALCVDDEVLLLEVLKKSVLESPDISEVIGFRSAVEALEWAKKTPDGFDIAFLDIQIHKMNGLDLAKELRKLNHRLPVVFCTGYEHYALDAFKVHASGYLTKPIHPADVQEQIDIIKEFLGIKKDRKLEVRCFGNFEVYADGRPLPFKRKKSKELLAYLIDRRGATISAGQLTSILWEDKEPIDSQKYLYQLIYHLKTVLKEAGFENVLLTMPNGYSVDKTQIECDYFNYLEGDENARRAFCGEYMFQYSWAEYTCGQLINN